MTKEELQKFEAKLQAEKNTLEASLSEIAVQDPENPENWNVKIPDEERSADPNVSADNREDEGTNNSIINALEIQLREVTQALKRIEDGTYGVCEKCGGEIAIERLEANPSAKTCVKCME